MGESDNLPIAVRRTRRSSLGGAKARVPTQSNGAGSDTITVSKTPTKPKSKKRVRFSDPGLTTENHGDVSSTTGLTPMVRRSSMGAAPSPKRRRHSTPARQAQNVDGDEQAANSSIIHFASLRQVLDDRMKRRIRRNGLSEEMNTIITEKRRRGTEQKTEIQRLRAELAGKDAEIGRLRDNTLLQDTDRILQLQQEVESLKDALSERLNSEDRSQSYDWSVAARDPFSDSYMDDEGFGDSTMTDIACSTPSKARPRTPFLTPPSTSPNVPETPCSYSEETPEMPEAPDITSSHVSVQASIPDPEKEALEAEFNSLRQELVNLTSALESHENLKARLSSKLHAATSSLAPPSTSSATPGDTEDVEGQLDGVLQVLSDRTAALQELRSSLGALGFPGRDAGGIVASLAAAFRAARLELEYLSPGELTLPLSSHGAEVLDLVLERLRGLARKGREDDAAIDEYHALELSLRQQLGARVDAGDRMAGELRERDARVAELEVGLERLKGAARDYRRDVAELERLVERLEAEAHAAECRMQVEVEAARAESSVGRAALEAELTGALAQVQVLQEQLPALDRAHGRALEASLAESQAQVQLLQEQLPALDRARSQVLEAELAEALAQVQVLQEQLPALVRAHGRALASRDARAAELRAEADAANAALRAAHETVRDLRAENATLAGRADDGKARAREVVDALKMELERVVHMSSQFLDMSGNDDNDDDYDNDDIDDIDDNEDDGVAVVAAVASSPRVTACSPDMVDEEEEVERVELQQPVKPARRRRRFDSGLGFLDEEEDEEDEEEGGNGEGDEFEDEAGEVGLV